MPEWSIGAVSKTVERYAFQGFESLSLRVVVKPGREAGRLRFMWGSGLKSSALKARRPT